MAKLSVELRRYFLEGSAAISEPTDADSREGEASPAVAGAADTAIASNAEAEDKVTLDEIFHLAGERAFGFFFVLLSLPSALPIPAPGYSFPFGVVMGLLAIQMIMGEEQPRLPKAWAKKGFDRQKVSGVIQAGLPWLERIEAISRPRLTGVCRSRLGRLIIGVAIMLMSACMMIIIPGTNTLPAIGIFVTGFGLLDDDGAISLAGLTICVLGLSLVGSILFLGAKVVEQFKDSIKQFIF